MIIELVTCEGLSCRAAAELTVADVSHLSTPPAREAARAWLALRPADLPQDAPLLCRLRGGRETPGLDHGRVNRLLLDLETVAVLLAGPRPTLRAAVRQLRHRNLRRSGSDLLAALDDSDGEIVATAERALTHLLAHAGARGADG